MERPEWIEWLGYFASVTVLISLTMSSVIKLRLFNMAGALLFVLYGFLIDSKPVVVLNVAITLVNLYHLYRIYRY